MSYQSEAQLENNLIKQLVEQGFNKVNIVDEEGLKNNFRHQIEEHNKSKLNGQPLTDKEFERILRHIEGKTVFKSAMILRDKFILEREDNSQVYRIFRYEKVDIKELDVQTLL